eukprot:CAMPEP_0172505738 /NCGR_PEP_ID=MMETSP1066-20121228/188654_1 /TAXON_ID=671091 /ORGANISM="Coscinodiscus wailesii, Strain CCMP2513" /LENGTH=424 /DNA_ID=CAMNT_0013282469 /DNA_START=38 /DNA_END=1312 /DNA_ORIENTATION=-
MDADETSNTYPQPGNNANGFDDANWHAMEEHERRASIKAIMADQSIPQVERRRTIQFLMDGRRNSSASITPKNTGFGGGTCRVANDDQRKKMNANEVAFRMEKSRPKCTHYERNCSIISPCCAAVFGCRICHDESPVLPPPKYGVQSKDTGASKKKFARSSSLPASFANREEPEHHTIDRYAIREIICRKCYLRQSSKTNECRACGVQFAAYHCSICNLWMSDEENPYHCPDCGFCRVGGQENFRHCHDCGMCIDIHLFDDHNCKVGKYMSNCPVCQEDLFSSRAASHEMPCGHAIHWHCFQQLASFDSRCPVCKKTAETPERMAETWSAIAIGIALQPIPPELTKVVNITCNDCELPDLDRRWHFLGVQCKGCSSFNTTVDEITMVGHEAAEYLDRIALNNVGSSRGDTVMGEEGSEAMDMEM